MTTSPCPRCGQPNDYAANFCSSCGQSIGRADEQTEGHDFESETHGEAPTAALIATQGPTVGSRYNLEPGTTTVGRHPESHIFLDDITVSRRHVEITEAEAGFEVRDVGSLNGTYLNRKRIDSAALTEGDELQVGRFKLQFVTGQ
jgi:pSer/pThr/pTyr-binding forkhead associated (FHA) protein